MDRSLHPPQQERYCIRNILDPPQVEMDALVHNPGLGVKPFASYTPNIYILEHIDTFTTTGILSLAKEDAIKIDSRWVDRHSS